MKTETGLLTTDICQLFKLLTSQFDKKAVVFKLVFIQRIKSAGIASLLSTSIIVLVDIDPNFIAPSFAAEAAELLDINTGGVSWAAILEVSTAKMIIRICGKQGNFILFIV